jgi:hypothetical protein
MKREHDASNKKVKALGNMECPVCGTFGQLKRRWNKRNTEHFQVDHYAGRGHVDYVRSCYIGVCTSELEKNLAELSDRRVLTRSFLK